MMKHPLGACVSEWQAGDEDVLAVILLDQFFVFFVFPKQQHAVQTK